MAEAPEFVEVLEISASAVDKIAELMAGRERPNLAVRVAVAGRLPAGGYQTEFKFVDQEDRNEDDLVQDAGKFLMYYDPGCAASVQGAVVDFDEARYDTGFHIDYKLPEVHSPEAKRDWDDPVAAKLQGVIDEHVNPAIAVHGGFVMLQEVKDDTAFLEMGGGCAGCGMAQVTLSQGVERMILEQVPEIRQVVDITNHEAGTNPYYAPAKDGESPLE